MKNADEGLFNQTNSSHEEVLKNQYQKLLRYCHFLTKNEWDGNDLAQEAFTKTIQHYRSSAIISSNLLKKVAYNKWIDIVRKRQKEILQDIVHEEEGSYHHLVEALITTDILLANTTPKQAVIFFLREAFDYQATEIANIMGSTEGAVKASLHRSRKRLENEGPTKNDFINNFWNEEERELLPLLFQESLREEDPSVLIHALPSLFAKETEIEALDTTQSLPTHTPSNVFKCVA